MNPFLDSLARQLLLRQGFTPEQIAQQLKSFKAQAPTQGNLFNLFQEDPIQTRTPPGQLKPKPVRPPVKGQMPLFKTPPARGPLTIPKYETPATNPFLETAKNTGRVGVKPTAGGLLANARGFGGQLMRGLLGIPATVASLSLSDFGQSGEDPDVRARRLGYASLEQQKLAEQLYSKGVSATDIKNILRPSDKPKQQERLFNQLLDSMPNIGGEMGQRPRTGGNPLLDNMATIDGMVYAGGNGKRPLSSGNPAPPQPAVVTEAPPKMQYVAPTRQRVAPQPKPAKPSKPMEQAYGASGKDLYMAHKKNNPLMIRYFGKNYGSKKAD